MSTKPSASALLGALPDNQAISPEAAYARVARRNVADLLRACPFGCPSDDCPLAQMRAAVPLEKRLAWLQSASDEAMVEIYRHHVACETLRNLDLK